MAEAVASPFGKGETGRFGVGFLGKRTGLPYASDPARLILETLEELADEGWQLSVQEMLGVPGSTPWAYDTSAVSDLDVAGIFEAPSMESALTGIDQLTVAGWEKIFSTEWILGPREFAPVGPGNPGASWGFVALWEWNDAWCDASDSEREHYDAACDIAFQADLAAGIGISGRHRVDVAGHWHHMAFWDAPSISSVNEAMIDHEAVSDFRFTVSRHYLGRRVLLPELLEMSNA